MRSKVARMVRRLGMRDAFSYLAKTKLVDRLVVSTRSGRRLFAEGTLGARGAERPLRFRYGTSDASVFWQVFVCEDYAPVCHGDANVIVDCGANVGYTSAYLASRYPGARVLAIEPDAANCAMVARNLASYGSRITVINKAIWSTPGPLKLVAPEAARGEWGIQVRACAPGEAPDVDATTIPELMQHAGIREIDILKVDIEGAELALFGGSPPWLAAVRNIIIEYHGERCREAFFASVARAGFAARELGHRMALATRA